MERRNNSKAGWRGRKGQLRARLYRRCASIYCLLIRNKGAFGDALLKNIEAQVDAHGVDHWHQPDRPNPVRLYR